MNMKFNALCLATLGGLASLAPITAQAGNVGYYQFCGLASPAGSITAAGHTPVALTSLDSSQLAGLDGLVLQLCNSGYSGSAAVDAAVNNGLRLMIDSLIVPQASVFPGGPALSLFQYGDINLSNAPDSPIVSGPGGILTDDSLDTGAAGGGSGSTSAMGHVDISTLPAGGKPLLIFPSTPNLAPAFYYPTGSGLVVVSMSQWGFFLLGGPYNTDYLTPGANTYYINTIAWMMGAVVEPSTTCTSEGYKGTQLTWCKNICENELSGQVLDTWIHRWVNRYRDLPYCAIEGEPQTR